MQKKLMLALAGLVALLVSCSSPVSNAGNGSTTSTSYNVRFITNNASTVFQTVQVDPPEYKLSIVPNPPAKDGYLFAGWFTEPGGLGTKVIARMAITGNLDVYENWSSYLYTVTFDAQGAETASDPTTMTAGSPTCTLGALPANPKKAGYAFGGWYTAPGGQGTAVSATTVFSANATVYARWDSYSYTVTYDSGDATVAASPAACVVATPSASVGSLPSAPEKTGYAFAGWFTGPSGAGTAFTGATTVTGNLTVYAKWVPYSRTVLFDSDGATVPASPSSITVSTPATTVGTLPTPPSKTGYSFAGWYTGQNVAFTGATPVSSDMTVYARWVPYAYTVTYDSGDATKAASPAYSTVSSPAVSVGSLPSAPEKTGYAFAGWYTGPSGSGTAFTGATTVTGSLTAYAKWVPYSRTVLFDSDGATVPASPSSMTVSSPASTVGTLPSAPSRTGYLFGGWYTEPDGQGSAFAGASQVDADMTVYAWWKAYTYTVQFDSRDATIPANPVSKAVASPATTLALMPADPVKTGYTFSGWFTGLNGSGIQYLGTTPVTGDMILYAYWMPDACVTATITFPSNGPVTIVNDNATVTKGSAYAVRIAETDYARYQWYVDGVLQASSTNALSVDTTGLFAGVHTVMIYVNDSTGSGSSASCRFTVKN